MGEPIYVGTRFMWEPIYRRMGARGILARCRGIADESAPTKISLGLSQRLWLSRLLGMDEANDSFDVVWPGLLALLDDLPTDARVAFLLNQVFDMRVDDVAALLRSDAAHCRELVERAREQIHAVRHEKKARGGTP